MARRCICSRLLAHVNEDPRLRTLPMAARMLWVLLSEAMARPGFDGSLPFSDTRRVSLLVSETQTDVETQMETLLAEGLLLREGGTLVCPFLREASARTQAARRNGAAGGRPRRGETVEAARLRRLQGEIIMAVPKPTEPSRWENPSAGVSPRTTTTTTTSTIESQSSASAAWQKLAQEAIAVAGLQMRRPDWTVAREWLEAGHSAEHVLAVVAAVAARPAFQREKVSTLRYFSQAIARGVQPAEAARPVPCSLNPNGDSPLALAIRAWEERGHVGPCPNLASLRAA